MAAPQQSVRSIQKQVQGIQEALQAFNEVKDGQTLAQRLEESRTKEYIVLRALLKKHLGVRYNEEKKIYECPVVENLQQLSDVQREIEREYPDDLQNAIVSAASAALGVVREAKKSELQVIGNSERNIYELREKIIKCEDINELNKLGEELRAQEESFKKNKEYIQRDFMPMYARVFKAELDKILPEINDHYSGKLGLILAGIESGYEKFYQRPVLTFSPQEAKKYGVNEDETLLPDDKESKMVVDQWQREERKNNLSVAIEHLERSMRREGAPNSKVRPYQPTQKAIELVDSVRAAVTPLHGKTTNDFLAVNTPPSEAEVDLGEKAAEEVMAVSNAMKGVQRNLAECKGELEKQRGNLQLKIQAEGLVRNYKIETGNQEKDQAVLDLIEIERAAQALEVAPAQLAWLPPLKEAMLKNLEQEGRFIVDECKKIENKVALEAMAHRLMKIDENRMHLGGQAQQPGWLQDAMDTVASRLEIKARVIVMNYSGNEAELGGVTEGLARIEVALREIKADANQISVLRNIAALKKEAYNLTENYIGAAQELGFTPASHIRKLIAIQRDIIQRSSAKDEPLLSVLESAVEEEAEFIRFMKDADLAGIFTAIRDKEYGKAAHLVRACAELIRERQAQVVIEPALLMNSSSQAASSSASSSSSSPAPNLVGSNPVLRSSIRSESEAKLTSHEDMPEYADNWDKGDMPLVPELFRQFIRNYNETKEEGVFSFFRTQKQSYDNMAQVMDHVLSNPLTDTREVSTASARALRQTLGCKKEDFLVVSNHYRIYKGYAENKNLSGEACFRKFVTDHGAQYPSVLGHFIPQPPAPQQGPHH